MEPFRVHILGCGSALPTMRHQPSAQIVEIRGKMMLVDCGEGTQLQLRRSRIGFSKVRAVFISHIHGDHCLGLIGMISTFGLQGRTASLHVYAPVELRDMLWRQIKMFCHDLGYEVVFHAVDTTQQKVVYEDRSMMVESVPLSHRVPCCGYLFREKPTLPHIRRDMIDFWKIPVSHIDNIKNGADWVCEDGHVVPHGQLTTPADPARSYAYCSDTRYLSSLASVLKGVDVLYHEATYGSEHEESAKRYYHSTARQAALVAQAAGVGRLYIGHYSARYDNEQVLLDEAQAEFPDTFLTQEGQVFDV